MIEKELNKSSLAANARRVRGKIDIPSPKNGAGLLCDWGDFSDPFNWWVCWIPNKCGLMVGMGIF